jgi:cytochrome c-type biogenesis protein CcmF
MEFIGEKLLPGQIGQFFAVLSFVASLLATVAYALALRAEKNEWVAGRDWQKLARWAFAVETFSLLHHFRTPV